MNREDLEWRTYHRQITDKMVRTLKASGRMAYVVNGSMLKRFGKKMPGISSHFAHTFRWHVMGQQVLTLGLSCEGALCHWTLSCLFARRKPLSWMRPLKMDEVLLPDHIGQANKAQSL